jgi:3-methyladenine DNA glycosylase Mpg
MNDWPALLRKPDTPGEDAIDRWFRRIAGRLLNGARLVVAGQAFRFVEVEFYYHAGGHPDPFTHRDPLQKTCGRWYFHRTRGVYRGGSFKGFDLTFGDESAFGGVLVRGLEAPDGTLIDGPCLCVDRLLVRTKKGDVASLDAAIAGRPSWDPESPLFLRWQDGGEEREVYRSARVGLSLKRGVASAEPPRFLLRPYRFLNEPRRTAKGKLLLVLALHARGRSAEDIRALTGCPAGTIRRYIADFEAGRAQASFDAYRGRDLGPADLCRLHGTWHAIHGSEMASGGVLTPS